MTAAVHDLLLTRDDRNAILDAMRELPPHPEVLDSLRRLQEAGLRLRALTNSTQAVAEAQLGHAGLARYFERIMSADRVRRLKPHAAVYHMAARECGVEPAALRLVAVHSWDVAGALRAGWAAAFVRGREKFAQAVALANNEVVSGGDVAQGSSGTNYPSCARGARAEQPTGEVRHVYEINRECGHSGRRRGDSACINGGRLAADGGRSYGRDGCG